jgi:hypothetical protein
MRMQLGTVVAVAALLAIGGGFARPVAATTFGPSLECPPSSVTLQTLISMRSGPQGPIATKYGAPTLNERALECLGSTELTFVGFRAAPEGLGGAYAYAVEPAWFDTWNDTRSFLALTGTEVEPGFVTGPFLAVAVAPDLQNRFDGMSGTWVSVRGHFDDAAAGTCRLKGDPRPNGGAIPTPADLVAMCRTSFVVTEIDAVDSPCPGGAVDWAAIAATPEHLRADCFGGARLSFDARGFSVASSWALLLPEVRDWELLDPAGGSDLASERAKALEAFVPPAVAIPNPSDAPWQNTDGIGGPDIQWRVEGHFDDERAAVCRADPAGMNVDGRLLVWTDEDAYAFCRNHLFLDSLEWIRPGTDSAAAPPSTPVGAGGGAPPDSPRATVTGDVRLALLAALGAILVALTLVAAAQRRKKTNG